MKGGGARRGEGHQIVMEGRARAPNSNGGWGGGSIYSRVLKLIKVPHTMMHILLILEIATI